MPPAAHGFICAISSESLTFCNYKSDSAFSWIVGWRIPLITCHTFKNLLIKSAKKMKQLLAVCGPFLDLKIGAYL